MVYPVSVDMWGVDQCVGMLFGCLVANDSGPQIKCTHIHTHVCVYIYMHIYACVCIYIYVKTEKYIKSYTFSIAVDVSDFG